MERKHQKQCQTDPPLFDDLLDEQKKAINKSKAKPSAPMALR